MIIGSLGESPAAWMVNELANSLAPNHKDVQVIYPSKKNVFRSLDGVFGGGCLPYRRQVHAKQVWLRHYFNQWKSDKFERTKVPPHIKTYAQIQDGKAAFILLTSANLSKAAWGKLTKNRDKFLIMSYEAGVLLLPKFVLNDVEKVFDLGSDKCLLPYDWPLTPYEEDDSPFFMDYLEEYVQ